MKFILLTIIYLCSYNAFCSNFQYDVFSGGHVRIKTENGVHEIKFDYNLDTREQKLSKLAEFRLYETLLINQLFIENDKFDRMAVTRSSNFNNSKNLRILDKQIAKQKKITFEVLSITDKLSEYMAWLRS